MATTLIQSETISFDQNIFTVINDLKKKRKRADTDSIHKEIIKTIDFKDTTKDDLQDRTNILLSSNSYFANSTSDSSVTPQMLLKGCETPSTKSIPDLTIGLLIPTNKTVENAETNSSEKNMDTITQYEKIKVESFKEKILQNLRNNIKEIFDSEFTIFKSKCEELVQTSSVRYNKKIDHLQNELKTKDK